MNKIIAYRMQGSFSGTNDWANFISNDGPSVSVCHAPNGEEPEGFYKEDDGWYAAVVAVFNKERCALILANINKVSIENIIIE